MTKITFLGTGGDNYLIGKCLRNSGGIVIQNGNLQFHIDPGPNSIMMAKNTGINVRETTAVICTNPKLLHCADLNSVIYAMTYGGMDIKGVLVTTKPILEGTDKEIPLLLNSSRDSVEKIILADSEKRIGIENVDIQFHATTNPNVVGMKIFMPDVIIGYSSDTAYSETIANQYRKVDILILNVLNPTGVKEHGEMSTDDAIKFIQKVRPQLTIFTGFGKAMLEQDPILEARRAHNETGCQVLAAIDGQTVSPASYSAGSKQKRLK